MSRKLEIVGNYAVYKYRKFTDREKLLRYQQRKIRKHLDFVTENSEFYKDFSGRMPEDFPVINKKIMMDNFDRINTVGVKKEEALDFAVRSERERSFSPKLGKITVGLSSGTSDTRGVFLVSDSEKSQWAGYVLAKLLGDSILKPHKVAFFMRANSNLYEAVKSRQIRFEFFDIFLPIEANIRRLMDFQPDILVGQPSVLLEICDAVDKGMICISPKRVISIAEVLEKKDEERIKRTLSQDVIHQVYQCTEGLLAATCKYGTLHLNEDIVHVEKQYLDETRFVPIITDFKRRSQPIIRYRLNDILVEGREKCPCGSCFTVLEKIEGREDDVFVFENEEHRQVKVFPDFIRRCVLFAGNIDNYRIVQSASGNITVYTDTTKENQERIRTEFENLAGELHFVLPELNFERYFYDKTRKMKRVESQYKGEPAK